MNFKDLNLIPPIAQALEELGYETPTPIQLQAIPHALLGKDILGCAQTGTGKTCAFAVPVLQQLMESNAQKKGYPVRSLIMTPTRELAIQIYDNFLEYGKHLPLRSAVIFGGVSQKSQEKQLKRGVDILVATPGRLLDLINQRLLSLNEIEIFILDEADRMLDMGFIHDVKKTIKLLPQKRQTLFFSATMPDEIASLATEILHDPITIEVTPVSSTAERIDQFMYFVSKSNKKDLLIDLIKQHKIKGALVFSRTKHGANRIVKDLQKAGISGMAIHGNKSQVARQNALSSFKEGKIVALVATDIAARGIDIDDLTHVFNYDLPNISETYVHRIGRTGRAGASGTAISFCNEEELPYLKDIQKLIGQVIPTVEDHGYKHPKGISSPPLEADRKSANNGAKKVSNNNTPKKKKQKNRNEQDEQAPRDRSPRSERDNSARPERSRSERPQRPAREDSRRNQEQRHNRPQRTENPTAREETRSEVPQVEPVKARVPKPKPRSEGADSNRTENRSQRRKEEREWSDIFQEPTTGKKGFVIKFDRDDKPSPKPRNRGTSNSGYNGGGNKRGGNNSGGNNSNRSNNNRGNK